MPVRMVNTKLGFSTAERSAARGAKGGLRSKGLEENRGAEQQQQLVRLLTRWWQYAFLTLYLLSATYFTASYWIWWLTVEKPNVFRLSLLMGFISDFYASWLSAAAFALPLLLYRASRLNPALPIPKLRVAMIVTKVPSEPFEMVQQTLKGLLNHARRYFCSCCRDPALLVATVDGAVPLVVHQQDENITRLTDLSCRVVPMLCVKQQELASAAVFQKQRLP